MRTTTSLLLFTVLLAIFTSCDKEDPFSGNSGTFTDSRDGNTYKWVRIGEQIWMAENLAYIPYVCPADSQCGIWVNDYQGTKTGPAKATDNYRGYGCLYDWETAMASCPDGWHLPSDEEWIELELYLGMDPKEIEHSDDRGSDKNIGGKLKEAGTSHWEAPNSNATNESGFTALPGGVRVYYENSPSNFGTPGGITLFWTSTKSDDSNNWAWHRSIAYSGVFRGTIKKKDGLSVRCIKD